MIHLLKFRAIGFLMMLLLLGNCTETKRKQEIVKPIAQAEPEPIGLTDEQKNFIKERFQQYMEVKTKLDKIKKSDGS